MMMMMMMTTIIQSFLLILLQHTQLYSPFEKAAQLYAKKMKVNNLTLYHTGSPVPPYSAHDSHHPPRRTGVTHSSQLEKVTGSSELVNHIVLIQLRS